MARPHHVARAVLFGLTWAACIGIRWLAAGGREAARTAVMSGICIAAGAMVLLLERAVTRRRLRGPPGAK